VVVWKIQKVTDRKRKKKSKDKVTKDKRKEMQGYVQ